MQKFKIKFKIKSFNAFLSCSFLICLTVFIFGLLMTLNQSGIKSTAENNSQTLVNYTFNNGLYWTKNKIFGFIWVLKTPDFSAWALLTPINQMYLITYIPLIFGFITLFLNAIGLIIFNVNITVETKDSIKIKKPYSRYVAYVVISVILLLVNIVILFVGVLAILPELLENLLIIKSASKVTLDSPTPFPWYNNAKILWPSILTITKSTNANLITSLLIPMVPVFFCVALFFIGLIVIPHASKMVREKLSDQLKSGTLIAQTTKLDDNATQTYNDITDDNTSLVAIKQKCQFFFNSVLNMFRDSGNIQNDSYLRFANIANSLEKGELDNRLAEVKDGIIEYISYAVNVDRRFIDLVENNLKQDANLLPGYLENVFQLTEEYRQALREWDVYQVESIIERIYIIVMLSTKLLSEVGHCVRYKLANDYAFLNYNNEITSALDYARDNRNFGEYRQICVEAIMRMSPSKNLVESYVNQILVSSFPANF